jgi:hypothetical protein
MILIKSSSYDLWSESPNNVTNCPEYDQALVNRAG